MTYHNDDDMVKSGSCLVHPAMTCLLNPHEDLPLPLQLPSLLLLLSLPLLLLLQLLLLSKPLLVVVFTCRVESRVRFDARRM